MMPPHQRLEVAGALGVEIDDRLVVHLELPAIHRLTQLGLQAKPGDRSRVHAGVERRRSASIARLGVVHRDVSVTEHLFGVGVPALAGRDADAGGHHDLVTVEVHRCRQALLHALHDRRDRLWLNVVEQHGELVATKSCGEVGLAQAGAQPLSHLRQQLIADEMAE